MDDDGDTSQGLGRRLLLSGAAAAATIVAGQAARAQGATAEQPAPAYVTLERRQSILLIGIDRPEVQNRIEVPTFLALGHAYWQLDHDEALRVAVLFAHGPDFSPGSTSSRADGLRAQVFAGPISEFVNPVGTSKPYRQKPLVAAAHGKTQLLGHELFLAADIGVAASDTRFAQAEVARGVFPAAAARCAWRARRAGQRHALHADRRRMGADEARRMALVQDVTEPGRELDRALGSPGDRGQRADGRARRAGLGPSGACGRRRRTGRDLCRIRPPDAERGPPGIHPRAAGEAGAGLSRTLVAKPERRKT